MVIYVDGPFYPDTSLSIKEKEQDLYKKVYSKMKERTSLSNFETHNYIYRENTNV